MPTVTYSPEDNKLRLYIGRVPRDEYLALKAAGFKALHKQREAGHGDFVATWTPDREDVAREYLDEDEDIGDEDYSPEERAADRAERFSGYRDKRADEAGASADTFDAGPQAFGHQSRARAERQAARHDRHRTHAVSQWSKAEYWQARTAGVIRHALHRSSAQVRRGRILTLESEQRRHEAGRAEYAKRFAAWQKVPTLDGADQPVVETTEPNCYGIDAQATSQAGNLAYLLANSGACYGEYQHPRRPDDRKRSLYSLLTLKADPITPREAAALWLEGCADPADTSTRSARWSQHYEFRLTYERAMLANEGGSAADADMERGGWIGKHQIHKVNKSPATGRVVSVTLKIAGDRWGRTNEGHHFRPFNIQRLPEGAYRAPTDAERQEFAIETRQLKAAEKAGKRPEPTLINPTEADAQRVQDLLNAIGRAKHEAKFCTDFERKHYPYQPTPILRMTQAQYSQVSKKSNSSFETRTLHCAGGLISRRSSNLHSGEGSAYDKELGPAACKVRTRYAAHSGSQWYNPPHIVVITDKPQKPLPSLDKPQPAAQVPALEPIAAAASQVPAVQQRIADCIAAHQARTAAQHAAAITREPAPAGCLF
jgi:hypothetical protein